MSEQAIKAIGPGPELNKAVAQALGYEVLRHHKSDYEGFQVRERFYLVQPDHVRPRVFVYGVHGTKSEAWADAPDFSADNDRARREILNFVHVQRLDERFLLELRRCMFRMIPASADPTTVMVGLLHATNVEYCYALLAVCTPEAA